jgi:hypothetical protein
MNFEKPYNIDLVSDISITLLSSKPEIVRRIYVLSEISLLELHLCIQYAMGWTDSHLFEFKRGDLCFGIRYEDTELDFPDLIDASGVQVAGVLKRPGQLLTYVYDFGDYWEHKIQLNGHLDIDPDMKYPLCVSGAGNCPPEDCGGIHGFTELLEILKDKNNPEYKDIRKWVGKKYDPDEFDLIKTNSRLRRVRARIKEYAFNRYVRQSLRR